MGEQKSAEFITQSDLARHFGLSKSYITKLAKKGVLDGCRKDGKLVRECAIEAVKRYRAGNRGVSRSAPTSAPAAAAADAPDAVKGSPVYTPENIGDLAELLQQVQDPNRRVQLTKDYWAAKLSELKAKEQEGQLIRVEDAVAANQKILKAYRDKMLALPSKLAPMLAAADGQNEIRKILDDAVYEILEEVSSLETLYGDR